MVLIEEAIMRACRIKIKIELIEIVMKLDITNICVVLCFTIFGYFLGLSKSEIVDLDLFSILSVIISVSALIIANQALGTWKSQFKYQEQYKSLVNAETSLKNYLNYQDEVRTIGLNMRQDEVTRCNLRASKNEGVDLPDYISDLRNLKQREYQRSWDELKIHCPDFIQENKEIEPDVLSRGYRDLFMELSSSAYKLGDFKYINFHNHIFEIGVKAFHVKRAEINN